MDRLSSEIFTIERRLLQLRGLGDASSRALVLGQTLALAPPSEITPLAMALLEMALEHEDRPQEGAEGPGDRGRGTPGVLARLGGEVRGALSAITARAQGWWQGLGRSAAEVGPSASDLALRELARNWTILPGEIREILVGIGRGRWAGVVGELVTGDANARRAVCELAGACGDVGLLSTLVDQLADREPLVGEPAEASLLRWAVWASGEAVSLEAMRPEDGRGIGPGELHDHEREVVAIEVLRAIRSFATHQRRGALMAGMVMLNPSVRRGCGGVLSAWLGDPANAGHAALRGVLRHSREPLVRRRAWEWLATDSVATACLDRLTRAETKAEHEEVLERWHLLANPGRLRRAALLEIKCKVDAGRVTLPRGGTLPVEPVFVAMSEAARVGHCVLSACVKMPMDGRATALAPTLSDPSPWVRLTAVRRLPARGLAEYCFDEHASVARSAALLASTLGFSDVVDGASWSRLTRSPHEAVRRIAAQEVRRGSVLNPADPVSRSAAWRLLRDDRQRLLELLRQGLSHTDQAVRAGTVLMVRQLGVQREVAGELMRLVNAPAATSEPRVLRVSSDGAEGESLLGAGDASLSERARSAAVTALAEVPGADAAAALVRALEEGPPRVRSNALESLAKRERVLGETHGCARLVVELKNDASHRVRGSAVRLMAWREPGKVLDEVTAMMSDPRPMHRLAGAWAAGRVLTGLAGVGGKGGASLRRDRRWPELCDRLVEVSQHDRDERVRARALAVRTRLENEVRDVVEMRERMASIGADRDPTGEGAPVPDDRMDFDGMREVA